MNWTVFYKYERILLPRDAIVLPNNNTIVLLLVLCSAYSTENVRGMLPLQKDSDVSSNSVGFSTEVFHPSHDMNPTIRYSHVICGEVLNNSMWSERMRSMSRARLRTPTFTFSV